MSARATFWAWQQDVRPATAKLVLLCLADCHNGDNGQCNPSILYIARMTGLDKKTVMNGIGRLEEVGAIEAIKRRGHGTHYRLHTSTKIGTTKNGSGTENGSSHYPPNQYQNRETTSPENGTQTYKESKKESKRQKLIEIPDNFVITDKMRGWAAGNVPGFDIDAELESWMDYWRGEGVRKADWVATWRNGMKSRAARKVMQHKSQYTGELIY